MGIPTVTETNVQPTGAPSPTSDSSSSSDPSSSGSGMSSGVTTGIGIGVGIGMAVVLAIAAAVFCMFWRRRKRMQHEDDTKRTTRAAEHAPEEPAPKEMDSETKKPMAVGIGPFAGVTSTKPSPGRPYPVVHGRHEMDVPPRQAELPAWSR
ncbi:hypothetical protein PG996_005265 [Apiospora saccharicola]|uniref:Uncharacterized protein n=1 Tax=Apiospora saccharicola TaxID=335842 RepID=A0ABR1VM28_9PEZI